MDCTPPGSSVHGILQARILEWVAMPFSRVYSQPRDRTHLSFISLPLVPPGKPESPNKLYEKSSNRYLYPLHLVKTKQWEQQSGFLNWAVDREGPSSPYCCPPSLGLAPVMRPPAETARAVWKVFMSPSLYLWKQLMSTIFSLPRGFSLCNLLQNSRAFH